MVASSSSFSLPASLAALLPKWCATPACVFAVVVALGLVVALAVYAARASTVPPDAEGFAAKCAADVKDAYGCSPGKGEAWCARDNACLNRMDGNLTSDADFARRCDKAPTDTDADTDTLVDTTTVTATVDVATTNDAPPVDSASVPTPPPKVATCCTGDAPSDTGSKCAPPVPPYAPPPTPPTAAGAPCPCPKPVYCPPCPKCPPPCPRTCPDLTKYVLKSRIPPCPEAKVDTDVYMRKSECKVPDMSKYVLKSSLPDYKATPCPPCICKCDGTGYDEHTDSLVPHTEEVVAAEEALGGKRGDDASDAAFGDGDLADGAGTGTSDTGTSTSTSNTSNGAYGSASGTGSGTGTGWGGAYGSAASANFEGTCGASSGAYEGTYTVQPVIAG